MLLNQFFSFLSINIESQKLAEFEKKNNVINHDYVPLAFDRIIVHFGQTISCTNHNLVQLRMPKATHNTLK